MNFLIYKVQQFGVDFSETPIPLAWLSVFKYLWNCPLSHFLRYRSLKVSDSLHDGGKLEEHHLSMMAYLRILAIMSETSEGNFLIFFMNGRGQ